VAGHLEGRSALVTGSTDGTGVAIANALAVCGCRVVITGRDSARGDLVVAAIREQGGHAEFVAADLGRGAAAVSELAAKATLLAGGTIDILVNNAAMLTMPAATADVAEDVIDQALAVNIKAIFLLTGILAPAMAARGSGAVVNIGSLNASIGMGHAALYTAAKAALHSLTRSWADEYGRFGVRVNTIAPGPILTDKLLSYEGFQGLLGPMLALTPSRRASTPEEVAAVVVFLVSDDAANIHGATLPVDGGRAVI
jgi:NAD(P)-dependent dehydrogenase (short-subunit alcohol dehydrogenase family)